MGVAGSEVPVDGGWSWPDEWVSAGARAGKSEDDKTGEEMGEGEEET